MIRLMIAIGLVMVFSNVASAQYRGYIPHEPGTYVTPPGYDPSDCPGYPDYSNNWCGRGPHCDWHYGPDNDGCTNPVLPPFHYGKQHGPFGTYNDHRRSGGHH